MRAGVVAVLLVGSIVCAEEWPQWRGPNRDGVLPSFVAPKSWPEKLSRKWKITVGEGYSSPVLAGGRIFLLTRQQDEEVVQSVDPDQGKILWRQAYSAPYRVNPAAARHGK